MAALLAATSSSRRSASADQDNRVPSPFSPSLQAPPQEPPSPTFEPTNGVRSPVLEALGERPFGRTTVETEDWAHAVPFGASPPGRPSRAAGPVYGTPPGLGLSPPRQRAVEIAYDSPPTFPPSRGVEPAYGSLPHQPASQAPEPAYSSPPTHLTLPLQNHPEEIRGGFSNASPPISPRVGHRIPVRPPSQREGLAAYAGTSPRGRPVSMPIGQYYGQLPPGGFRDSAAGFNSRSSSRKPDDTDFYAFDMLPTLNDDVTSTGVPGLLLSSQGSLFAYEVGTEALKYHGHIEGLRGKVLSAKVIPVSLHQDKLRQLRPLVVVIVHGHYIPTESEPTGMDPSQHDEFDPSESVMQAMHTVAQGQVSETQYQTTVEVYSLKERQHVATLYRSPVVDALPVPGSRWELDPPPPVGGLAAYVKGRFVVVSSAISGEVYMYVVARDNSEAAFRCIGKTWTGTPTRKARSWSTSSASAASESDSQAEGSIGVELPVLALSGRWLAVLPPLPASKTTLHGTVDLVRGEKPPPNLSSHAPGSQPAVTCELDTPFEDSRINRYARDVAQEVLKGAQWVGAQGYQAWRSYWNKPEPAAAVSPRSPPQPPLQFPPTHAEETKAPQMQSPAIVAILDLDRLAETQAKPETALNPIATFPLPDGCSFLSFSPSGLNLLTASAKGDVQYVWDLMRMTFPRTEAFGATTSIHGPLVRQVARYTRVTKAHIIDVVWNEPRGERLAILTDRGTVHLHDLPASAFAWPPPRAKRPRPPEKHLTETAAPVPGWGATLSSMTGRAQPILAAARDTRLPSFSNLNISGAGAAQQGGKIMASGFSKSVGAATGTVHSLRSMGENRLHVPSGTAKSFTPGTVRWLAPRDAGQIIAVVGDKKVRLYSVVTKSDPQKPGRKYAAVSLRLAEHALPALKEPGARLPRDGILLGGTWPTPPPPKPVPPPRGIRPAPHRFVAAPLAQAELEPLAPFLPVHADPRVVLSTFDESDDGDDPAHWAFGELLRTRPVHGRQACAHLAFHDDPCPVPDSQDSDFAHSPSHPQHARAGTPAVLTPPSPRAHPAFAPFSLASPPKNSTTQPSKPSPSHLIPADDDDLFPIDANTEAALLRGDLDLAEDDIGPIASRAQHEHAANPLAGSPPYDNDHDNDNDVGPIASMIRYDASPGEGASPARVTVSSRPVGKKEKKAKKGARKVERREEDSAQAIVEAQGHGRGGEEEDLLGWE